MFMWLLKEVKENEKQCKSDVEHLILLSKSIDTIGKDNYYLHLSKVDAS